MAAVVELGRQLALPSADGQVRILAEHEAEDAIDLVTRDTARSSAQQG